MFNHLAQPIKPFLIWSGIYIKHCLAVTGKTLQDFLSFAIKLQIQSIAIKDRTPSCRVKEESVITVRG